MSNLLELFPFNKIKKDIYLQILKYVTPTTFNVLRLINRKFYKWSSEEKLSIMHNNFLISRFYNVGNETYKIFEKINIYNTTKIDLYEYYDGLTINTDDHEIIIWDGNTINPEPDDEVHLYVKNQEKTIKLLIDELPYLQKIKNFIFTTRFPGEIKFGQLNNLPNTNVISLTISHLDGLNKNALSKIQYLEITENLDSETLLGSNLESMKIISFDILDNEDGDIIDLKRRLINVDAKNADIIFKSM